MKIQNIKKEILWETENSLGTLSEHSINLFNAVQIMIMLVDINNQIIFCNDFLIHFLNLGPEELSGKNIYEIFSPLNQKKSIYQSYLDASQKNIPLPNLLIDFVDQNGSTRSLLWNIAPIIQAPNKVEIFFCCGKDITDQINVEKDLGLQLETLEQHIGDRTVELETLYSVATIANEVLEIPVMLKKMLNITLNAIGVPYGAIHLFDPEEKELLLEAQVGIPAEIVKRISSITPGFGLTGWVTDFKQPLTLTNVSNDPRILAIGQVSGYSQYLSAPLCSQYKVMGVISVFGDTIKVLNPERVALLTTIADQIGVALERSKLRSQAEQVVILEERQRVARELHDSVTQSLYSLTLLASAGQRSAQDGSMERTIRNLEKVNAVAFQTLKEMRLLVYELQPSTLSSDGFVESVQRRLDGVEEHAGMQTSFVVNCNTKLPKTIEIELYGLAQEALNNSIKHSGATAISVNLYDSADEVVLEIKDNGSGFTFGDAQHKHGSGMTSMVQRVQKMGGHLDIITEPGQGTNIMAKIPNHFEKLFIPSNQEIL